MEWITTPQIWLAFFTLTALEIVLGIDNIIFIAILADRLPKALRAKGRTVGLGLAMITRILLLFSLTLVMRLTEPLFAILGHGLSGRDLILIGGGLFLLGKSTLEIHHNLEGDPENRTGAAGQKGATFFGVIAQIMVLDIVFSLDSVITAIGLTDQLGVMVAAIVVAVIFMIFLAGAVSRFVEKHPTLKNFGVEFPAPGGHGPDR